MISDTFSSLPFAEPYKDQWEGPRDIQVQVQARIHSCWSQASVPWRQVQGCGRGHADFPLPTPHRTVNLATVAAPHQLVIRVYFPSVIQARLAMWVGSASWRLVLTVDVWLCSTVCTQRPIWASRQGKRWIEPCDFGLSDSYPTRFCVFFCPCTHSVVTFCPSFHHPTSHSLICNQKGTGYILW